MCQAARKGCQAPQPAVVVPVSRLNIHLRLHGQCQQTSRVCALCRTGARRAPRACTHGQPADPHRVSTAPHRCTQMPSFLHRPEQQGHQLAIEA